MKGQVFIEPEFNQKLSMFLDGELSKEEERDFITLLQKSPEYLSRFNQEKSFHEFLRSKIQRRPVSPALVQSIKAKIMLP